MFTSRLNPFALTALVVLLLTGVTATTARSATPEEIKNTIWATKYAQQAAELVSVLVDLNVAQQRIKALEEVKPEIKEN